MYMLLFYILIYSVLISPKNMSVKGINDASFICEEYFIT